MTENLEHQILLTIQAQKLLQNIRDKREQQLLIKKLEQLKYQPEK